MSKNNNYLFYGLTAKVDEVTSFIKHIMQTNIGKQNSRKTPVCIWGTHGIGKTELVKAIADDLKYQFVYIAPAQFEEMGDLIGMPSVQGSKTAFNPPDWIPTEDVKGILLIDDVNRADDRILRGIMQLLQNYELISWRLPSEWQIVLTANPDGGDYSVTPMDDAMLTRMAHITMEFNAKTWAVWAEKNHIDSRGINFVLTYPEVANGNRTTPRTLVQFFNMISEFKNLEEHLPMVQMLGNSCLDDETVASFMTFVQQNLDQLIDSERILNAKDFKKQVEPKIKQVVLKEIFRVDIMATIATRLIHYLEFEKIKLDKIRTKNLQAFIKMDFVPNDLRLTFLQDIVSSENKNLSAVLEDAEISFMLLEGM